MDDKSFQKLLNKASKCALEHRKLMEAVGVECIERFGHHYSDLDIDSLIDSVNHGVGTITVEEIKKDFEWALRNKGLSSNNE